MKIFIVTGAFGALGRVVARTLAARGDRVALVDAAPEAPPGLVEEFGEAHLLLLGADLSRPEGAEAAVRRVRGHFGAVHGLANVAGGFRWETIEGGDPATWQAMFSVNVLTALHACRAVLPVLQAAGGGRIVNVGAGAAAKAAAGMGAYAASKAGVLRLTEALADECKDRGITVNAVLPSVIDTPANRRDMPDADFTRWVSPDALADVVAFLLSDAARAVTGAGIPVSGRM
jgi:NAD(P)-dependent dehydrogenase (short-subunit alcohol dehydrogenase family)